LIRFFASIFAMLVFFATPMFFHYAAPLLLLFAMLMPAMLQQQ